MINLRKINLTKTKYLHTILIAAALSCMVVVAIVVHARMSIEDELYITNEHQSKMQRKFTESILSQEDVLGKLYSEDYKYNIYMGDLHLSVGDFAEAEAYYQQAIYLAPDATYDHYLKLMILYLRTHQIEKAEQLENSVVDKNSQKLIKFKCRANILLGDYYYQIKNGTLSNKKYKLAEYYFDKLNVRKVKSREYIKNGVLASFVQIADKYVDEQNYLEAYRFLKRAETVAPENLTIKYKLALVLSYIDPMKSIDYFDIIKKNKPQMVSFYLYYETLMRAAEICRVRGELPESKLYAYKAGSIKNFYENNIVNAEVIFLDFLHSKVLTSKKSDKFVLKYRLTNITTHNLSNVKMDVIFYNDGHPMATFTKTVFTKDIYLRPNETSPIININFNAPLHFKKNVYENISYEIYLYSNEKYKTLMYKGDFGESLVAEN